MTLFGYGITTKAIAQKFGDCKIYDDKFSALTTDKLGNSFHPSEDFDPTVLDLEITSPGIPPHHPLIKKAKHLVSEYDLFATDMPTSIWISGTNGKTSTTEMVQTLLKDKGSLAGGNIGEPVANLDPTASIWILETSSFTLHYTTIATPNIYILLPITADHISWHGGFEEYEKAKLKPLSMMGEGSVAIVPKKYAHIKSDALVVGYESVYDLADYFDVDLAKVQFKEPFLTDALLALAAEKILFDRVSYEKINSYQIGRHRVEEFKDNKNRVWINDSKATNPDATIAALTPYKSQKIYLILGGDDKDADQTKLFETIKEYDLEVFTIGSNENKLTSLAKDYDIPFTNCKHLKNAVKEIDKLHSTDAVSLLSPAAASLDQYSSYAQRGEEFIELVKSLR
jgi:UDP-N-acetylmuramoylalanine--D-glutamate ligase